MSWQVTSGKLPYGRGIGQVGFADAPETGSGNIVRATAPTVTNPVVGTQSPGDNSTKAASTAFVTSAIATAGISGFPLQGYLSGLTLSTAGGSGTFGIAAGVAADSTTVAMMSLASAYTKTTGSWTLGSGNGALDTGSIVTSTWYHAWLISRSDTGVVDVLVSLSPSAPTMPASYDRKRYIGSMKTDGSSHWIAFTQTGNEFLWTVGVKDQSAVSTSTANRTLYALSVPTGIVCTPFMGISLSYGGSTAYVLFTAPSQTDSVPSGSLYTSFVAASQQLPVMSCDFLTTNTSAQVGVRSTNSSATFDITTFGFRVLL